MPRVSDLTEATVLDTDDELYAVVDGDSRRVTLETLTDYTSDVIDAPIKPTATVGPGNFVPITPATGAAAVLPAGGQWAYKVYRFTSGGVIAASAAGVAAGGTTIAAGVATQTYDGFAWRFE
jgi:hypothetical protein